jgi:hypothetical protein
VKEDGGMEDETGVILASIRSEFQKWKGRKLKFEEQHQAAAKALMSDVNNLLAPLVIRPSVVAANGYEAAKRGVYFPSDWQADEQKQSEAAGLSVADLLGSPPKPPEQPIVSYRRR